ncbi:MAG: hypothetical protein LQ341_007813, partial [Variospora aurantia]
FEDAWREITPPSPPLDDASEPNPHRTSDPATDSPALLPPVPPFQAKDPAPSQATTTDITQATPAHVDDNGFSSPSLQRVQTLSSSSPLQSQPRGENELERELELVGYQGWNGIPLTDSELLPASLLDDSLEMLGVGLDMEEEMEMEMEEE